MRRLVVYTPALRSSHLERLAPEVDGARVELWASGRLDDLDPDLVRDTPLRLVEGSEEELARRLRLEPPDVLEVTEPLWQAQWGASVRLARAAQDGARALGRRPPLVTTHAIEVLARPLPSDPGWWSSLDLVDAADYGTPLTAELYGATLPAVRRWASVLLPERRPRCERCYSATDDEVEATPTVAVVAEFTERKATDVLLAAWPSVADSHPDWRLALVGHGPLTDAVVAWAAGRPEVSVSHNPSRELVHDTFRSAALVALPGRRVPGWREQVGLSLVEGDAHGCGLVCTTETGLAPTLAAEGHEVVAPGDAVALAAGLGRVIARTGSRPTKRLPSAGRLDSRVEGHKWALSLLDGPS